MVKLLKFVRWLPLILLIFEIIASFFYIASGHKIPVETKDFFYASATILFLSFVGFNFWYFKIKHPKP
jgi:hypothetical protein